MHEIPDLEQPLGALVHSGSLLDVVDDPGVDQIVDTPRRYRAPMDDAHERQAALATLHLLRAWLSGSDEDADRVIDQEVRPVHDTVLNNLVEAAAANLRVLAEITHRPVEEIVSGMWLHAERAEGPADDHKGLLQALFTAQATRDFAARDALQAEVEAIPYSTLLGLTTDFVATMVRGFAAQVPGNTEDSIVRGIGKAMGLSDEDVA